MNHPLALHPKTASAGMSGALGVLVVWLLGLAHVTVDPIVAGALVGVLAGVGSWLAPLVNAEKTKLVSSAPVEASPPA